MIMTTGRQRSRRPDPGLHLDPALVAALVASGQRLTHHRSSIIVALIDSDRPLTVDDVVARVDVPLSTAYRNLHELCAAGVVSRINGADRADRFEIAESFSDRHHHHHLICTQCGTVSDFDTSAMIERAIAKELAAVATMHRFQPSGHVFDIVGRCADCAQARSAEE
jgi:Fur family transcriptional regulator, ferric uptake regulator